MTVWPEGSSLALGQKFYHDGNSKAEGRAMNDAELKATLKRVEAMGPCDCLICRIRKIGFGPKGTILTKPKKAAKAAKVKA